MFRMVPKDYAPPPSMPEATDVKPEDPGTGDQEGDPNDPAQDSVGKDTGCTVGAQTAGYRDPEMGPFMCSNCSHFQGESACDILTDPVDPDGLCNLFWTKGANDNNQDPNQETDALPEATDVEPVPQGPQG